VVLVFQPPAARGQAIDVKLKGLEAARPYQLRAGLDGEPWQATGEQLMAQGLQRLLQPGHSEVILLEG
jgi:hypothetical protein